MHCHDMRLELRWLIFYMFEALGHFHRLLVTSVTPPSSRGPALTGLVMYLPPLSVILFRGYAIQLRRVKVWQYINT